MKYYIIAQNYISTLRIVEKYFSNIKCRALKPDRLDIRQGLTLRSLRTPPLWRITSSQSEPDSLSHNMRRERDGEIERETLRSGGLAD